MRDNIKKIALCVAAFAAVLVFAVPGTNLWLSIGDKTENRMAVPMSDIRIVEEYTPPGDWVPGETVTKRVSVVNQGGTPVLVRISFQEELNLLNIPAKAYASEPEGGIPQLIDETPYSAAPWQTPQEAGLTVSGLPAGVELRVNKQVSRAGTATEKTIYGFAAWRTIAQGAHSGRSQRVTAEFTVSGGTATAENLVYWYYDGWIGTAAKWNSGARPTVDEIGHALSDTGGQIAIEYTSPTEVAANTPSQGGWWFNPSDGCFYYIGRLEAGAAAPNLIEGLTLASGASSRYDGMTFDLTVHAEAMQPSLEAITSDAGWGLAPDGPLAAALGVFCDP